MRLTSSSSRSGTSIGSASTLTSRWIWLSDAAFLDAFRLADELDDDLRLDRLVEPDLLEVDVEEAGPRRDRAGTP